MVGLGAAGAGAGAYLLTQHRRDAAPEMASEPEESLLARGLRKRLPMLILPPEVLSAFIADHERYHGSYKGRRVPHALVQTFLLSTDFFPEADEAKALSYLSYHDPYLTPCRNPFRRTE